MKKIVSIFFIGFSIVVLAQDSYSLSSEGRLTIEGTSTAHSWVVSANKMEGSLTVLDGTPATINFEVMVANVISERGPTMDKKMHAALKKDTHPAITFVLKKVKETSTLVGTLRVAGIEQEVEIPTEISSSNNEVQIKGEKKITLQEFDIEPPTAMFGQIVVGKVVTVRFDMTFNNH